MGYKLKRIYVGTNQVRPSLPSEYQRVEYIKATGTQYINTGYVPSNNTKIRLSMDDFSSVGQYNNLFGVRYTWSSSGRGFLLGYDTGLVGDPSYFAMFNSDYGGISASTFSFTDGNSHIIEMSQNGIYEDSSIKQTLSTTTFTAPGNLYIFCDNDNGTASEYGSYKLYSMQIYENDVLVRKFIPCYRKSDTVIGLYDLINDVFYTNQGTGTFTKGGNV